MANKIDGGSIRGTNFLLSSVDGVPMSSKVQLASGKLRASDDKERTLAVEGDLCPAILADVKAASERVESHQGLGQGLL
jgi:hypothetical protein